METANKHTSDYEAIIRTLQYYIDGSLAGKSQLMQVGFHIDATIYG